MFQNYLKIAWRNLLKYKSFSFINIAGLAIGIAACMIIFLYVYDDLTFDRYNVNADRIVRVTTTIHAPESDLVFATAPAPLGEVLKRDYPEVESVVRLENTPQVIKFNNELFREDAFYKADDAIFSIFSFDFLEGTAQGVLLNPNSVVLTETLARKYFGNAPAVGKTLFCNEQNLLVTGVVKDRPANSDIRIDALLSTDFSKLTAWMDDFSQYTFILFKGTPDLKNFRSKLGTVCAKYIQPELNASGASKYKVDFQLEPLRSVHFSVGKLQDTPKGSKQTDYLFSLLAAVILLIALLNYINLSTAKSMERAKEVGIRKVSGAVRSQLVRQFLFESLLLLTLATALAVGLLEAALPFFNKLLQTKLVAGPGTGLLFMVAIFLTTLLLAGLYPAFVLSAFKPVQVLKGNWRHSIKGIFLRKAITIAQFAIAAGLITGTVIIYSQMKYVQQKDLGFNKDQLLNIFLPRDSVFLNPVSRFQDALSRRPEVRGFTVGDGMAEDGNTLADATAESEGRKRELMCYYYSVDPNFLPVFQLRLLEGRNLSADFPSDKKEGFLVNEAFVKTMGWKTAVGRPIEGFGRKGRVVGVVKDFYYKSLHNLVEPLIMVYNTRGDNTTTVKIAPRDLPVVKELFKSNFPSIPFDYSFIDERVDSRYRNDRTVALLFNAFTIMAIFVSCLGLYGLVSLIMVQRTREIGIRKVLGARLGQLLTLLTKDFVKLVIWGLVIALPVAGIAMNKWLGSYAYHIRLSWWMFFLPVLLLFFIAAAVISREVIKAALGNPVNSLRTQ